MDIFLFLKILPMPVGGTKNKNKIKIQGQENLSGIRCICLAFFILGVLAFPKAGKAIVAGYSAEKVAQSYGSVTVAPGKALTFEVAFKNTGTATWYNNTSHFISLYTDNSGKLFRHKYWYSSLQPAKMIETKVAPGNTAHFRFALQAPEIIGFYTIKFKLAAEDLTWIPGGVLEIPINITMGSTSLQSSVNKATIVAAKDFQAKKIIQSHESISINGDNKINFIVGFKNIGINRWEISGSNLVKICVANSDQADVFRDVSWFEKNCPAIVSSETLTGQIGYFNFYLKGNLDGNYIGNFVLMNGDQVISGGEVSIPIQISGSLATSVVDSKPIEQLSVEPMIRIGLYSTVEPISIRANTSFEVRDSENNIIFSVPAETTLYASFNFKTKQYAATMNGELRDNLSYLRFIAPDLNTIFEITNYENRPTWNTSLNDNKFRGNLELRYSEGRDKLYVINELPMETYLKGLAESANNNPIEYHKALAIAARTYAQYNINIGGKHPAGYFHLNASAYDQVYRGYNSEIRLPNFVRAVLETRGMMVTYNNEVVVTPYFAQSDGRTRAWEEVWPAPGKPWLVARPDPNCAGMSLWGHGVGLSARGARGMALAGNNFEQILKHYYSGIEIKKIY